ncbi:cysteine-rich and transmembrane domain-containing protein 1-like [Thalassophryne amazonica]|uniref:cysteine-rich and transmembrane domain-containing protein 1-like n=1 Tax=Thalassophryne amazonica TaxID=390379 RepID=UPI0014711788|nr:cysteine-rich and transmembrane domain-containing protein 1-like [Thalassophryne amazonica]
MSGDRPPPYGPPAPGGPSAPGWPAGFVAPPTMFPGSPCQAYPAQVYAGGGNPSGPAYYQGPPGAYMTQPGYQSYQGGPYGASNPWEGSKGGHMSAPPPQNTVYVVEERGRDHHSSGRGLDACLAACSAALCCCCLWDIFT